MNPGDIRASRVHFQDFYSGGCEANSSNFAAGFIVIF
jgi:hypothetical protein